MIRTDSPEVHVYWGLTMKQGRILVLILCACSVSAAWAQQPTGKGSNDWSEFHRTNMVRWNANEKVLNVKTVRDLQLKWSFAAANYCSMYSSPAVVDGVVYIGSGYYLDGEAYSLYA